MCREKGQERYTPTCQQCLSHDIDIKGFYFIILCILQIFYDKHVDKKYKNVPQNDTPSNPYWPSEGRLRVRPWPGGQAGVASGSSSCMDASYCHAPAFRAPLQLGRGDLDLGPKGNTEVDLSSYASGHGADVGRRLRGLHGQFCTFNESGTGKALSPGGAFHLGDPAIYGNSWGRTPEAMGM